EWVHVQLHQQKGMISLSPPTICNSADGTTAADSSFSGKRKARSRDATGLIHPVAPVKLVTGKHAA
ncbi:hypothetical protein LPQ17_23400, partial [Klebsiella pneumoniae]|nr:hypothetical protein [Klebsiella pneumoniae]